MLPRQAPLRRRAARSAARPLTRLAAAALFALALLAAGCGDGGDEEDPGTGRTGADLTITLDADGPGGKPQQRVEIACSAACPELESFSTRDLAPTPANVACTEIYGGPDVATIEGEFEGEPVQARLTRANGCEIERFNRFTPLLRSHFPGYEPGASLAPPG